MRELFAQGEEFGDNAALEGATELYKQCLALTPRDHMPLQWAMTQNNLGNALARLGERESGMEKLKEAVLAYNEVLKEWTREHMPLEWAMTQNNLGIVLETLGERETGTARAVSVYREALMERTRARAAPMGRDAE